MKLSPNLATWSLGVVSCVLFAACTTSEPGGSNGNDDDDVVQRGSETNPDSDDTPQQPAPTGKACNEATSCAYYYCECEDGAVVNSRNCSNGSCQAAAAHCGDACAVFDHGDWTGGYGGGDTSTAAGSSSSSGSAPGGSSSSGSGGWGRCVDSDDCSPYECGCTDGSRIRVRDCLNGVCLDASQGCDSACEDSDRGGWDGT